MKNSRKIIVGAGVLATTLLLSACSGGMAGMDMGTGSGSGGSVPSTSATANASFNTADVTFAQMMKPHHEGAVAMSDVLLAKQGIDQRVVDLAKAIRAAQEPEIAQFTSWLTAWGADASMGGMNMSMAPGDMSALEKAQGTEAAKLFLQQMTVHHQTAIQMAQTEIANGKDPAAKKLAQDIVTSQTAEIATMKTILASL